MKTNPIKNLCSYFLFFVLAIIVNGCKKETPTPTPEPIPFQGPQNPSFESSDNYWKNLGGIATRKTGTGFLPSEGVWYCSFAWAGGNNQANSIYQDNIDLTKSTSMTFDYTLAYTTHPGITNLSATVKILFTSNGTVTFWQQTIDSTSSLPIQTLNKKISLPTTTQPGRLLIQASLSFSSSTGAWPDLNFGIDNFRVN